MNFTKSERLNSLKEISTLIEKGQTFYIPPFKVTYLPIERTDELPLTRILISVPKRIFKRAVIRNLLKRRIRESYRLNKEYINGMNLDFMLFYNNKAVLTFDKIEESVKKILQRLAKESKG